MSDLYLTFDTELNKMFVIKTAKGKTNRILYFNQKRLMYEGILLEKLDYISIPKAKIITDEDATQFLVIDYIRGKTLEEILKNQEEVQLEYIIFNCLIRLCEILNYLHSQEVPICHRDIKPSNIMLTRDNEVFLIDFGSAAEPNKKGTINLGTVDFCAPEQLKSNNFDCRSDIYSLGAVMQYLFTQKKIYSTIENHRLKPIWSVIKKCMRPLPENRYQSCLEIKKDILEFL